MFSRSSNRDHSQTHTVTQMPKPLTKPNDYKSLVRKVSQELSELEFFLKRRTAEAYWKVGRYIHEHLLEHKDRAEHGTNFFIRLAEDVDYDVSILQRCVKFYRVYPISAAPRKLTWEHYKSLITVKDEQERKKLEQKVLRHDWNTKELREYLNTRRELTAPENDDKPVAQLKFTFGRLHAYQIVQANKPLAKESPLVLDLGFRLQYLIPKNAPRFKENDTVELLLKEGEISSVKKIESSKDELFTYQAQVDKIIDGDTLLTSFDLHLNVSISQKLRLRGIDCPEMDTEEGRRAKRFVEARLKGCAFIIVKTIKDRSDKFDRYLADIFYLPGATDPSVVAQKGTYLNQELLNEHLAVRY